MKKTPIAIAFVAATTLGASNVALADSDYEQSLDRDTLDQMIDQAASDGMAHFEEFSVDDDDNRIEIEFEGWNDEEWALDLTYDTESGDMISESRSSTDNTPWGLEQDQLSSLLDRAGDDGLERFDELDIDDGGQIEISGYDADESEMELDYDASDFQNGQ